jgi:hypothetical protein
VSGRTKIRLALSPEAERYVRRDAPVEVRRLAAGGALPLPPVELVTVLFVLVHDADETAATARSAASNGCPTTSLAAALGAAHPAVLSYCAQTFRDLPDRLEAIALNTQADDATIAFLASLPHKRLVDIVSNNQERMLRCPDIVEALGTNPLTGRSVIDRILSFLGLERGANEEIDETEEPLAPAGLVTDAQALAALEALLGDDVSGRGNRRRRHRQRGDEERTRCSSA